MQVSAVRQYVVAWRLVSLLPAVALAVLAHVRTNERSSSFG